MLEEYDEESDLKIRDSLKKQFPDLTVPDQLIDEEYLKVITFSDTFDVVMLCSKFEVIPSSIFQVRAILRKQQNFEKIPVLYPMVFSKKNGSEITPNFLLHFSDTY